jgi:glycosyltransferase involved in cell wall biosynthesis
MEQIFQTLQKDQPDVCCVHFPIREFFEAYKRFKLSLPFVLWFHGVETLSWRRRLFNVSWDLSFPKYVYRNYKQLKSLREFLESAGADNRVRLVYVSDWMHRIAERDLNLQIPRYDVIPNPIDCDLFNYKPKNLEQRYRILILRSFESRKYANDISVEAIIILARLLGNDFAKFQIRIIGWGKYFKPLMEKLGAMKNVAAEEGSLPRESIPKLHEQYGIFLCPTRQDAQGVSMCEAMASGLVPVTSRNTAIPEFVKDHEDGLLTGNSREIAVALRELADHGDLFAHLSAGAARRARAQCDARKVTDEEISIMSQQRDRLASSKHG